MTCRLIHSIKPSASTSEGRTSGINHRTPHDDVHQLAARLGRRVLRPAAVGGRVTLHDRFFLQMAQPPREGRAGDPREAPLELVERGDAPQDLPHHEEAPASPEEVERPVDGAVLVSRHWATCSQRFVFCTSSRFELGVNRDARYRRNQPKCGWRTCTRPGSLPHT